MLADHLRTSAQAVNASVQHWPLVAGHTFILATRDTGYRSLAAALAELIDNALQADARHIRIFVAEERTSLAATSADVRLTAEVERTASGEGIRSRRITIAVLDDGTGMSADALRTALQFGGSERFNDRGGAGRFGMGLPNSSVSQARRLEVYTWQAGGAPLFSYLDVDEIAHGHLCTVPMPKVRALPHWVEGRIGPSGTLVVWPTCDRLPYRRSSTVRQKLREAIGRLFRYAIWNGVHLTIDDIEIEPIDPLLQSPRSLSYGSADPFGEELRYEVKIPSDPISTSTVHVRFSLLPVAAWAKLPLEDKRRLGVIGGAGVSVVRAGREIDHGWYFMGGKRRENYDDWWRCEVRFEPALDEYFGVTHSKQGVTPHPRLLEIMTPDMEHAARTLNARIRGEFVRLAQARSVPADESCTGARHGEKPSELPRGDAIATAARREQLLPPLTRRVRRYRISADALPGGRFFDVDVVGDTIVLTLNTNHPFYQHIYLPAFHAGGTERYGLECVLLAAARGELAANAQAPDTDRPALEFEREAWSDALAAFLSGN